MDHTPSDAEAARPFTVCFVCAGNICRSPMAEAILTQLAEDQGVSAKLRISSAGIGDWHVGEQPDPRTVQVLRDAGWTHGVKRARQFDPAWFAGTDLIVALDRSHERVLRRWASSDTERSKIATLLSFDPEQRAAKDVPDPYYLEDEMFSVVLTIIEKAAVQLLRQITPAIRQGA